MRISTKNNSVAAKNSINMPVKVTAVVQKDGQTGIKGTNLIDGSDVTVFLTNRGKAAENPNRNSLEKLTKGYKIGRTNYKLEPGGLVSFRGTFPHGDSGEYLSTWAKVLGHPGDQASLEGVSGEYLSTWANVLGYNKDDAQKYCRRSMATLRMFERNGKISGTLYVYEKNPERHLRGASPEALKDAVTELASFCRNPSFLIRQVDQQGQVCGYEQISKSYSKDAGRALTPDEIAAHVMAKMKQMAAQNPQAVFNILPVRRYTVSPAGLTVDEQGKSQATHFQNAAKAYLEEMENGDLELYCKDTFYKLGGEKNDFVNGVYPIHPFGPGEDPVLIGGLSYAPDFVDAPVEAKQADNAVNQEAEEIPPQAVTQDEEDDPFAALDGDSFFNDAAAPR